MNEQITNGQIISFLEKKTKLNRHFNTKEFVLIYIDVSKLFSANYVLNLSYQFEHAYSKFETKENLDELNRNFEKINLPVKYLFFDKYYQNFMLEKFKIGTIEFVPFLYKKDGNFFYYIFIQKGEE